MICLYANPKSRHICSISRNQILIVNQDVQNNNRIDDEVENTEMQKLIPNSIMLNAYTATVRRKAFRETETKTNFPVMIVACRLHHRMIQVK